MYYRLHGIYIMKKQTTSYKGKDTTTFQNYIACEKYKAKKVLGKVYDK